MPTNIVPFNVYQINQQDPIPLIDVSTIGFPTQNVLLQDTTNSPTRSLSTGVNVYTSIQTGINGSKYYVRETFAQCVTLFNT